MKNMNDVADRIKKELDQWFIGQCNDLYAEYYLYYLPTTAEHDGGIIICNNRPLNPEYQLGSNRIGGHLTKEQNFRILYDICRKLPILEY